jgi:hypothetical protein
MAMRWTIPLILSVLVLGPVAAGASDEVHEAALPDCYCRTQARLYLEGDMACLATPDGPRLAECGMALNVMSWMLTDRPCPLT